MAQANRDGLLRARGGKVSPETEKLLEVQKAQIEQGMRAKMDGQAPAEGSQLPSKKEELTEAEKDLAESALDRDQLYPIWPDYAQITEAQRAMMSPERRKDIESRLQPMSFAELLQKGSLQQDIPILPNEYVLTLRTVSQKENFFCLQYIYEHTGSQEYSQQMFNTCKLVCAVVGINGGLLPDHRVGVGTYDEQPDKKLFTHKLNILCHMATVLLADMGIQYDWFNDRVARFFTFTRLKNG